MKKLMLAAAGLLSLAACDQYRTGEYGASSYNAPAYTRPPAAYGSAAPPAEYNYYGNPAAADRAAQGCDSSAPADWMHQNRPGGTDYNPARCRVQGY